jgi:hypothetical protein
MTELIDIADLDVIYLTYDEPKKEEFWIKIQNMIPWAKRVDGVKGSDAAHKSAALASETDRFILVDGDNIPDSNFFNLTLSLDQSTHNKVFRWRARNQINGLQYGNGGLSSWTKEFVMNMKTHEASNGIAENDVEFCFHPDYWAMSDCYSTTYPNQTPFQAWRAGFREGVKMCLDRGTKPTLEEFETRVHSRNYDHLCIWQSVGADVENGFWAIYGARMGTRMTMLESLWDYRQVQDFEYLADLWNDFVEVDDVAIDHCKRLGDELRQRLGLPIVDMDPEESKFFKHHYKSNFKNQGIMTRE